MRASVDHATLQLVFGFRFSVFAISIPQLRTHAGVVAGSRLMRRDLHSICFSSALHTAARPGPRPRQRVWSAVNMGNRATFKARLERCHGVWSGPRRARRRVFRLPDLLVRPTRPRASSRRRRRLVEFASFNNLVGWPRIELLSISPSSHASSSWVGRRPFSL